MKIIFAVCLLLAFTCAQSTFTPEWKSCENVFGWRTLNVTMDDAPVAGQYSRFNICGLNKDYYNIEFDEIRVTSGTVLDLCFWKHFAVLFKGIYCYTVDVPIPQGSEELTINFEAIAKAGRNGGCVNVTLSLENNDKFLGF